MKDIRKKILKKYEKLPKFHRKFIEIRSNRDSFSNVEKEVPKQGTIIDLGCGHGYFSHYLFEKSNKRKIIGIDFDKTKIPLAQKSLTNENIKFLLGDIAKVNIPAADTILTMDVIYFLKNKDKEILFKNMYNKLKKGGLLILKEPVWGEKKFRKIIHYIKEILITSFFKRKPNLKIHYVNDNYWKEILKRNNFEEIKFERKPGDYVIAISKKI